MHPCRHFKDKIKQLEATVKLMQQTNRKLMLKSVEQLDEIDRLNKLAEFYRTVDKAHRGNFPAV